MSLSDPKVQRENSEDWVKAQKAKSHKIAVDSWLDKNPRIGVLNNGYYYYWDYTIDAQVFIKEFGIII